MVGCFVSSCLSWKAVMRCIGDKIDFDSWWKPTATIESIKCAIYFCREGFGSFSLPLVALSHLNSSFICICLPPSLWFFLFFFLFYCFCFLVPSTPDWLLEIMQYLPSAFPRWFPPLTETTRIDQTWLSKMMIVICATLRYNLSSDPCLEPICLSFLFLRSCMCS